MKGGFLSSNDYNLYLIYLKFIHLVCFVTDSDSLYMCVSIDMDNFDSIAFRKQYRSNNMAKDSL